MEFDLRVPCLEGTTDMSCKNCHICANTTATSATTAASSPKTESSTQSSGCTTSQAVPIVASSSSLTLRRICTILLLINLITSAAGCGPGRGIGGPRPKRKITPLVHKQHVPNMSEQSLGASGSSEGSIDRQSAKFKKLEFNNNKDIIFKDEEGTGADHVMTRRCKEKLNTLAISVMNQWPGVRLRVTESWEEEHIPNSNPLHYEGRAVDITTSDRDRTKYGMLARLAVEAGFDWVYYESRAHIHCSVKSDSSHTPHNSGCFTKDSTVLTLSGEHKAMSDLAIGDQVLSMNDKGEPVYSEVVLFIDRNLEVAQEFVQLTTEGGAKLTVTPAHLVMVWNSEKNLADYVFADRVEEGDQVFVHDDTGLLRPQKVIDLKAVLGQGVVAPLTKEGTIVVDNVAASCYAVVNSQSLAHWSLAPLRVWSALKSALSKTLSSPNAKSQLTSTAQQQNGVHWYAKSLYGIKNFVLPKSWRHQ